jgi:hypothetical protein
MLLTPNLAMAQSDSKITLCHIPPDDPENVHTIHVSSHAVDAHLAHGDELGECAETPEPPITGELICSYSVWNYPLGPAWWSTSVDPTVVTIVHVIVLSNGDVTESAEDFASPGSTEIPFPPVNNNGVYVELWLDGILLDTC